MVMGGANFAVTLDTNSCEKSDKALRTGMKVLRKTIGNTQENNFQFAPLSLVLPCSSSANNDMASKLFAQF